MNLIRLSAAILFLTCSCFAFHAGEVALLVNPLSTIDVDGNGVPAWRDIVLYYKAIHTDWDTSLVCSLKTYDPTPSSEEDIPLSYLHYDLDTTARYGESASIGKNGSHHYLLQQACSWMTTNGKWGKVKCWVIVMGLPLRTQHNSLFSSACGGGSYPFDSTTIWSVDNFLAVFAHPGMENNGSWSNSWSIEKTWTGSYRSVQNQTSDWNFYPGVPYFVESGSHSTNADTVRQWVTTCRLDGFSENDVRGMISRAARATGFTYNGSTYTTPYWGLIDQDSVSAAVGYAAPLDPAFTYGLTSFQAAFGNQVYWDAGKAGYGGGTGSGGAIPDTIETRWGVSGGRVVPNAIQFYFTAGKHNTPAPGTTYWYNLQFPIAIGAIAMTPESFGASSCRDTLGRLDSQGIISEAIKNGFTYALGTVCEPTTAMILQPEDVLRGLTFGYMDIARAGQMASRRMKLGVSLGDPLGNIGRSNVSTVQSSGTQQARWRQW